MRIPMTDEAKLAKGFYIVARAFIQAYPAMAPWEIVMWVQDRLGEKLSALQINLLKQAWNDNGLRSWDDLMLQHEIAEGIM